MFIGQYISNNYQVLLSDSVDYVLSKMDEYHCAQLPVVDQQVYHGLITYEDLLEQDELHLPISSITHTLKPIYLFDYQHIYDALQLISAQGYALVPVLDKQHEYQGVLTKQDLLEALNETLGNEEGAIIVLELGVRDNALSHIARIIESENTSILSTAVHQVPDSSKLEMTIKVNKNNIAPVVASLWRNDYVVKATFRDGTDQSDIQSRYELLMNYLDI
jgi:predicted transcriptional regulator